MYIKIKRLLDLMFALILLIITSPIMVVAAIAIKLESDGPVITKVGYVLRKSSIDELPQLFNILKGEMSFIGPRPLLVDYLEHYSTEQMRRHDVLPGISGWAQVHGRSSVSYEEKFDCDVYYVDNISLLLDIKILFLTVYKVVKKEDVNQDESKWR